LLELRWLQSDSENVLMLCFGDSVFVMATHRVGADFWLVKKCVALPNSDTSFHNFKGWTFERKKFKKSSPAGF